MIQELRNRYNQQFTSERYQGFLKDLNSKHPGAIDFRVAETPVFVDREFAEKLYEAGEYILDFLLAPGFKSLTERAIPPADRVAHENDRCHLLAFDYAVCRNEQGVLEPRLIELQGFPSLLGFQVYYPDCLRRHFSIPDNFSQFLNGYNKESFLNDFRSLLLANHAAEEVILLEIQPHHQKTRIDFYCTQDYTGIPIVCLTELIQEGKKLYYLHPQSGKKTRVRRIYNRVIFDELHLKKAQLGKLPDLTADLEVEWIPHPNWFYRISKYTLPFLKHPYVPPAYFVDELKEIPRDLGQYVLKPLFSFGGQGVLIDVRQQDLEGIRDPENWILQKKIEYAPVIPTPDEPAKVEIRMLYIWKEEWSRPKPVINLARLSKGKMIGVRYNQEKEWVGGSVAFFEH
jgi:hypothetical protein